MFLTACYAGSFVLLASIPIIDFSFSFPYFLCKRQEYPYYHCYSNCYNHWHKYCEIAIIFQVACIYARKKCRQYRSNYDQYTNDCYNSLFHSLSPPVYSSGSLLNISVASPLVLTFGFILLILYLQAPARAKYIKKGNLMYEAQY